MIQIKKCSTEGDGDVALCEGPAFNHQYLPQKRKKEEQKRNKKQNNKSQKHAEATQIFHSCQ